MFDILGIVYELSILAIGAVSALLGIICSLLAMTGKYAAQIKPLVRMTKLCACLFLAAPVLRCLLGGLWMLEDHMFSASVLYVLFAAAWFLVFVVACVAHLVSSFGKKKKDENWVRPKTLHISALCFLVISLAMNWLFA